MTLPTPQAAADIALLTFNSVPFGLAVFDSTQRLVKANPTFRHMMELTEADAPLGTALADIVQVLSDRGEYLGQVGQDLARQRLQAVIEGSSYVIERARPNGRWIEVRHVALACGHCLQVFADVTDRIERRWRAEGAMLDLKARVQELEERMAALNTRL